MKCKLQEIKKRADDIVAQDCIVSEFDLPISEIRTLIWELEQLLVDVRTMVCDKELELETEIYCFKVVKPQIVGRILFLKEIIKLKSEEMHGMPEFNRGTLNRKTEEIHIFLDKNIQLLRYIKSHDTKFDKQYFTRLCLDHNIKRDTYYCNCHSDFSTDGDMELSQLFCYEYLCKYITYRLQVLENEDDNSFSQTDIVSNLKWTKSQVDLIELGYALYSVGAFNNGNADICEIMRVLEIAFGKSAGNYYKGYIHCRGRIKERTAFLKQLTQSLTAKMDSDDDNTK